MRDSTPETTRPRRRRRTAATLLPGTTRPRRRSSDSSSPTRRLFRPGLPDPSVIGTLVGGRPGAVLARRAPRPPTRGLAPPQAPVGARAPRPARAPLPEDPPARAAAGQAAALGPPSSARSWRARPLPTGCPARELRAASLESERVLRRVGSFGPCSRCASMASSVKLPHDVCLPVGELPACAVKKRLIPSGGTLRRPGIATVRHRIAQVALKLVLEPSS
jgi:hypothetical protein